VSRPLKIFLFLTGIFFLCGSLEIDVYNYDNTFFDSYDTYIHTDSDEGLIAVQQAGVMSAVPDFNEVAPSTTIPRPAVDRFKKYGSQHLFLTHSVWRI